MNWLDKHIQNFVIPGLWLLSKYDSDLFETERLYLPNYMKNERTSLVTTTDVRHIVPQPTMEDLLSIKRQFSVRPAKGYNVHEGLVRSAARSFGLLEKTSSDLVTTQSRAPIKARNVRNFNYEHNHIVCKNIIREVKDYFLVLPGRDTWLFYVWAQKIGKTDVFFDPLISRAVAQAPSDVLEYILKSIPRKRKGIVVDTGFFGSVTEPILKQLGPNYSTRMLSSNNQPVVFPRMGNSRKIALEFEYVPKYQKTGMLEEGKPQLKWWNKITPPRYKWENPPKPKKKARSFCYDC